MIWRAKNITFDFSGGGLVMGVLNVTADSFSDGGRYLDVGRAVAHGLAMARDGADIIDVGGESTRPGAEPVSAEEELRRVLPVIGALLPQLGDIRLPGRAFSPVISIDTSKAIVAREAVGIGAAIVNDVTGLAGDGAMESVVRESGAGAIVMHMRGRPQDMQANPEYGDVVGDVGGYLRGRFAFLVGAGIAPERLAFDPGIGFGKTVGHNLELISGLRRVGVPGRPLVLGVSRKSFIGKVLGSDRMEDRDWPTVAITSLAREFGCDVIRVHDVLQNVHALRMTEAILGNT